MPRTRLTLAPFGLGGGVGLVLGGLMLEHLGAHWGWGSAPVVALAAASAPLLALWIRIERRVEDPLIDLRTLARRGMAATNATTFLVGFATTRCCCAHGSGCSGPGWRSRWPRSARS